MTKTKPRTTAGLEGRKKQRGPDHLANDKGRRPLASMVEWCMPLKYQPKQRDVVMCDFSGFIAPEMIKVRPVVVIARHRTNSQLVTVVPLSTTKPLSMEDFHHEFSVNPLPDKPHVSCWAKCDMVATVALHRLERYKLGRREYVTPQVGVDDFKAIQAGVRCALKL